LLPAVSRAHAQAAADRFPDRPVRILIPFAPGGNTDTVIRILAPKLQESLGQSVVVENRPGGGGADVARDLAAGVLDLAVITGSSLRPLLEDGRAVGVALTSGGRRGAFATLPTVAESGFPGFDLNSWNGLFAPAATPASVVAKLDAALQAALADPATQQRILPAGNDPSYEGSATFATRVQRDREVVRRIVAETGIRID
jgi:tripartite-type tricarboxylate transporter receptor subunit TctC